MATIVATVTSGLHATATKTYNLTDAEMDRIVAAYQSDANASVNGTATYAQTLLYMFNTVLVAALVAKAKAAETVVTPGVPIVPV